MDVPSVLFGQDVQPLHSYYLADCIYTYYIGDTVLLMSF